MKKRFEFRVSGGMTCVCLVAAAGLFLLDGCVFKTGLGDPAQSKVDAKLAGYWINEEHQQLLTVVPLDKTTCLVDWMAYSGTLANPHPTLRVLNRAWLTELDGSTYVSLKMVIPKTDREEQFSVMRIELQGKEATAWPLQGDFAAFRAAATPEALAQAIRQHKNAPNAFGEPATFRKTTDAATAALRQAFFSPGR